MGKDLILAHDLGTTGNKATLVDQEGTRVASTFCAYDTFYPNIGWAEQDPEDWWKAFRISTAKLIQENQVDAARIAAVSFSGQMMGCLPVDRDGNPLRRAIIWADHRAIEEASLLSERLGEERVYEITGHRISPTYSVEKLLWIKRHEPDAFKKTYKVLHAKDFLRLRLTGTYFTDYSDASSMNLFDIKEKQWSAEITDALGLSVEILPEVRPSTYVSGEMTQMLADELGLVRGTPVIVGGGDGPCAAVGAGVVAEGDAYNYVGSSSWIALAAPRPIYDPERRTFNFYHLDPDTFMPTGTMQSAGASYQWLRNNLCHQEVTEAARLGTSPYELMDREASKSPPGAKGLLFLPYLMGERSPHWNPSARGVFIGLTQTHRREDMIRAVLEGVGFNLRIILDAFVRQGIGIPTIRVIGGGAKGALWRQILADIFDRPVLKLDLLEEATSLGAAIAGGIGVGLFHDFKVAQKIVRISEVHYPDSKVRDVYEREYDIFQETYRSLVPVYTKLQGLVEEDKR